MADSPILRHLQIQELGILLEVDRICKKGGVTYYLIGGTALGAVRHKGFIPWDDDIDIGIPRKDYELFLQLCKTELDPRYFLQTRQTDENYVYEYAKIRVKNTAFVQEELKNIKMHHGVFVDIFPLDGAPNNRFARALQKFMLRFFCSVRNGKIGLYSKRKAKSIIQRVIAWAFDLDTVHSVIDRIACCVDLAQSERMGNMLGTAGYEKEIMPKEYFEPARYVEFEGYLFPVPNKTDLYLQRLYGDYMKLPPVEERKNHNPYLIDLRNEYHP